MLLVTLMSPTTCKFDVGFVVPMPTLPDESCITLSKRFVWICCATWCALKPLTVRSRSVYSSTVSVKSFVPVNIQSVCDVPISVPVSDILPTWSCSGERILGVPDGEYVPYCSHCEFVALQYATFTTVSVYKNCIIQPLLSCGTMYVSATSSNGIPHVPSPPSPSPACDNISGTF